MMPASILALSNGYCNLALRYFNNKVYASAVREEEDIALL